MKIIISGGTGLLGRILVNNWSTIHGITILTRSPNKHTKKLPKNVKLIGWDGKTSDGWGDLVNETDIIINLAGENLSGGFRWTKSRKRNILESRKFSGQAITEAIRLADKKPKLLIQASGINYYGFSGEETKDEFSLLGNDYLANVCRDWEDSTKDVEEMGVRRVILRTAVVLTTKGGALKLMSLPYKFFIGGRLSLGGNQWFSWIHYLDYIKAINYFIENEKSSGAYNIVSPQPVRQKEFNKILGKTLRRPWFFHTPSFPIKLVFGEKADLLLKSLRIIPTKLLDENFSFGFADLTLALMNLYEK